MKHRYAVTIWRREGEYDTWVSLISSHSRLSDAKKAADKRNKMKHRPDEYANVMDERLGEDCYLREEDVQEVFARNGSLRAAIGVAVKRKALRKAKKAKA